MDKVASSVLKDAPLRSGVAWNNEEYKYLLNSLNTMYDNDVVNVGQVTMENVRKLVCDLYGSKAAGKRRYLEAMYTFLQSNDRRIMNDCRRSVDKQEIKAPELEKCERKMSQILRALISTPDQEMVSKYLYDSNFTLPLELRKSLANDLGGTDQDFRQLNMMLTRKRSQIISGIMKIRQIRSMNVGKIFTEKDHSEFYTEKSFSCRTSSRRQLLEQKAHLRAMTNSKLQSLCEEGLEKVKIDGKGFGVRTTRVFLADEFLCEYAGELITEAEAKKRDIEYAQQDSVGSYMLRFNIDGKRMCIDATADNGRIGRFINHSRKHFNAVPRQKYMNEKPVVYLVAKRNIDSGEEVTFDYGERDPVILQNFPWLKD